MTPDVDAARAIVTDWYGRGKVPGGGLDLLLEEPLAGREVSVFAICDGRAILPFAGACDYKRAGDGDTGPNTGGMGAYSPPAGFPDDLYDSVRERILAPLLRGLLAEGEEYVGVLYCGLMWCADGPRVIEFNARFGDPETQVLVPRIGGDFAELLRSAAQGAIDLSATTVLPQYCAGVVLATADYPRSSTPIDLSARRVAARRLPSLLGRLETEWRKSKQQRRAGSHGHGARRRPRASASPRLRKRQNPRETPRCRRPNLPHRYRQTLGSSATWRPGTGY